MGKDPDRFNEPKVTPFHLWFAGTGTWYLVNLGV